MYALYFLIYLVSTIQSLVYGKISRLEMHFVMEHPSFHIEFVFEDDGANVKTPEVTITLHINDFKINHQNNSCIDYWIWA